MDKNVTKAKLRFDGDVLFNQNGDAIASKFDNISKEEIASIEVSRELLEETKEFIFEVNKGTLKPRTQLKRFEKILDKYNDRIQ